MDVAGGHERVGTSDLEGAARAPRRPMLSWRKLRWKRLLLRRLRLRAATGSSTSRTVLSGRCKAMWVVAAELLMVGMVGNLAAVVAVEHAPAPRPWT